MAFDTEIHHSQSIRLQDYDYTTPGCYFITICIQDRSCLLGEVVDENAQLNDIGEMVAEWWHKIPVCNC